nr:50S ribosomal protein L15, large subunit ribosomal protein L15 [uncultured Microgenomates bacterium Rifle_16ft_4_minimus_37633]
MKLPKVIDKRKKRLGRGYGSGKGGHTSSRGQKGQKSRGKVGVIFEGYKVKKSLIKRLPLRRGKDKFKAKAKAIIVDINLLNIFKDGSIVDLDSLIEKKLVNPEDAKTFGVKVLGNGKLEKKLTISLPISKSGALQVEKLGGKVIVSARSSKLKTQS